MGRKDRVGAIGSCLLVIVVLAGIVVVVAGSMLGAAWITEHLPAGWILLALCLLALVVTTVFLMRHRILSKKVEPLMKEGDELLSAGRADSARTLYSKALKRQDRRDLRIRQALSDLALHKDPDVVLRSLKHHGKPADYVLMQELAAKTGLVISDSFTLLYLSELVKRTCENDLPVRQHYIWLAWVRTDGPFSNFDRLVESDRPNLGFVPQLTEVMPPRSSLRGRDVRLSVVVERRCDTGKLQIATCVKTRMTRVKRPSLAPYPDTNTLQLIDQADVPDSLAGLRTHRALRQDLRSELRREAAEILRSVDSCLDACGLVAADISSLSITIEHSLNVVWYSQARRGRGAQVRVLPDVLGSEWTLQFDGGELTEAADSPERLIATKRSDPVMVFKTMARGSVDTAGGSGSST